MEHGQTASVEMNPDFGATWSVTPPSAGTRGGAQAPARFWPHDLLLGLMPLVLCAQLFIGAAQLPQATRGIADFRQLYAGGFMIRTGHAAELYDYEAQRKFEDRIAPLEKSRILPINHFAFEELLFVPFSFFPYKTAYWLFFVFNFGLLGLSLRFLKRRLGVLSQRWAWFPPLLLLAFRPIVWTLVNGQDSILTLALLAGALFALDQSCEFAAGILVGAAMYKFQIVLPIALLFLIWHRWRFCCGFAASAVVAGLMSLWIVGFHGMVQYAHTMADMSMHLVSQEAITRYGASPLHMLNLRSAVLVTLGRVLPQSACLVVIGLASVAVLWAAAKRGPSLPNAITAAALVSYHFLPHDASILLIPTIAALSSGSVVLGAMAALLLLSSMITSIVWTYNSVVALVILVFFIVTIRTESSSTKLVFA
ncbi:MAG TPA: glycosyltransferase family 87 protein [Candidatus Sulfotelmatobacter sp.]|nr:glycosyltransferase family 87 protein [Candidatus Sulfotelmatobacter sp.]